jgi:hypothetical protein
VFFIKKNYALIEVKHSADMSRVQITTPWSCSHVQPSCAATVLKETSDMPIINGGRHSKPCKNKFYIIVCFKQATYNTSLCNNVTSHAIHDILNLEVIILPKILQSEKKTTCTKYRENNTYIVC